MRKFAGLVNVFLATICLAAIAPASAEAGSDSVRIVQAWARASIGTSRPAAAYVTVVNAGHRAVTLTGASSSAAGRAMVHRTVMEGAVMKMLPAGRIEIAAGKRLVMKPGGYHIMLMNLKRPLKKGESVDLTLRFGDGTKLTATAKVLGPGARGPE